MAMSEANAGQVRNPNAPRRSGGSIFAPPIPFDPEREGPTEEQKARADRVHETELQMKDLLKQHEKKQMKRDLVLVGGSSVVTAGAILGGQAIINKVFAEEPAHTADINSFPNNFSSDYDVTAEEGRITPEKRLVVPKKDINTLDESGNPLFLLPLILGPEESIEYEYASEGGEIRFKKVKAGTPIVAGQSGYAFAYSKEARDTTPAYITSGVTITEIGPDGKVHIFVVQTGDATNKDPRHSLKLLESIPIIGPENSYGRDYTKGFRVELGDELGQTNEDVNKLQTFLGVRTEAFMRGEDAKGVIIKRLNLATTKDASGSTKIATIDPKTQGK